MRLGFFITFEGGEGTGKSTQIRWLAETLQGLGREVVVTREPGGSSGAEAVRHVLLSGAAEPFGPEMEALLFAAARLDHVEQIIRPAVARGAVVLCDRFVDSSRVYQGVTGDIPDDFMKALERVSVDAMMPNLTLVLDLDPSTGLQRASVRRGEASADRYEKETVAIHERRRQAFLDIARAEPERCRIIDAASTPETVAEAVATAVWEAMPARLRNEFASRQEKEA